LQVAGPSASKADHIRLTAGPTERGFKLRLAIEPGALRMIEAMHRRR
jgi:hypothetical protein